MEMERPLHQNTRHTNEPDYSFINLVTSKSNPREVLKDVYYSLEVWVGEGGKWTMLLVQVCGWNFFKPTLFMYTGFLKFKVNLFMYKSYEVATHNFML